MVAANPSPTPSSMRDFGPSHTSSTGCEVMRPSRLHGEDGLTLRIKTLKESTRWRNESAVGRNTRMSSDPRSRTKTHDVSSRRALSRRTKPRSNPTRRRSHGRERAGGLRPSRARFARRRRRASPLDRLKPPAKKASTRSTPLPARLTFDSAKPAHSYLPQDRGTFLPRNKSA